MKKMGLSIRKKHITRTDRPEDKERVVGVDLEGEMHILSFQAPDSASRTPAEWVSCETGQDYDLFEIPAWWKLPE